MAFSVDPPRGTAGHRGSIVAGIRLKSPPPFLPSRSYWRSRVLTACSPGSDAARSPGDRRFRPRYPRADRTRHFDVEDILASDSRDAIVGALRTRIKGNREDNRHEIRDPTDDHRRCGGVLSDVGGQLRRLEGSTHLIMALSHPANKQEARMSNEVTPLVLMRSFQTSTVRPGTSTGRSPNNVPVPVP